MNNYTIKNDIRILQWNCRSINSKVGELCKLIQIFKIDVVLLQETFLSDNKTFKINNFNIIRNDRNSQGGGVAIAIKNNWKFKKININSNIDEIELIGCKIKIDDKNCLDIVSIYINHNFNLNMAHIDNIFNKVETPFIIGGDFNAHSMEWGCENNSPRGEVIHDALEKYDSIFLNDGSVTRFQTPPNQSSAIDLTITNSNNSLNCTWEICNTTSGSDHFPIITKIMIPSPKKIPVTTKIMSQKRIERIIQDQVFEKGMSIDDFMKTMEKVIKYAEIEIEKKNNGQNKPWWNNKCSEALALSFQLTKKFRQTGDKNSYDNMIKQQKEFKKITKQAKKDGWYNFCSSITRESSLSEIWKMAKIFKGNTRVTFSNEDCEEWIEEFMSKHSQPTPRNILDINKLKINHNPFFEREITKNIIQNKIMKLKKSASGIDKISNNVLKSLPASAIEVLADSFNEIIKTGKIPEEWKITKVIPLNKPGKPTNEAASKRPISIFGKIRRLFESCFLESLEKWAENEKKYSPSQYGFRKGKSTRDCVANLIADVKIAWAEKKMVGAVILDISAAYDNVSIETFVKDLNDFGAPRKTCALLWEMYSKKFNKYVVNNEIVGERISSIGFPQGLPSSPASFNLVIAKLDKCLKDGVKGLQFADDNIIYCAGKNIKEIESKLNETLINLVKFMSRIGLSYSKDKTKSIVFSRKHQNALIDIRLGDQMVAQVDSFKYVGILLDRKLLLTQHMKQSAAVAGKAVNIMRSVAGTRWGVDPRCLDMLYKGCIRSKLEYCSFIYDETKNINILEKIQWRALRIISGCMKSTHTKSLEVLTAIEPLQIRFQKLTSNFLNNVYSYNNPLREKLKKLKNLRVNFMSEEIPELYQYKYYPFFKQQNWDSHNIKSIRKIKTPGKKENITETEVKELFLQEKDKYYKDCEMLYTDGSKKDNLTAYAIYHANNECKSKLRLNRENVSIFVAEGSAILEALAHMHDEHQDKRKICVVTDSLSVIESIQNTVNGFKRHFIIGEILNLIEVMARKGAEIHLWWVPSHKGIRGNEVVDELAQQAINEPEINHDIALHFSEIPAARRAALLEKWQMQWNNSDKGRFCYSIIPKIKTTAWYKETPFDRKSIIFWNRIISNHTRCKNSLNRFLIINSPLCSCGDNYQTIDHLIFECHETASNVMLLKLKNLNFHPPYEIRAIIASEIGKCDKPAMKLISQFMVKKLLHKKLI